MPQWLELHQAIYDAIRAHDPDAAQRAMQALFAATTDYRQRATEAALERR